jgi:hypothetical protein
MTKGKKIPCRLKPTGDFFSRLQISVFSDCIKARAISVVTQVAMTNYHSLGVSLVQPLK